MMTRHTFSVIDDVADAAGELHCRLEELAPSLTGPIAVEVARAAELLDEADALLTKAYCADPRVLCPEPVPVSEERTLFNYAQTNGAAKGGAR
jgi:hypothetical protein